MEPYVVANERDETEHGVGGQDRMHRGVVAGGSWCGSVLDLERGLLAALPGLEPHAPGEMHRDLAGQERAAQRRRRAAEGDAHRSAEFSNLAMQLDQTCFSGGFFQTRSKPPERAKDIAVLSFLGLPDCGSRRGGDASYVYSYWRTDTKSEWVVIVQVKDGLLEGIGWNDASVNDFSTLRQYRTWSDVLGGNH